MADDGGKVLSYMRSLLGVTKEFNDELDKTGDKLDTITSKTASVSGGSNINKSTSTTAPTAGTGGAPVAGKGNAPVAGGSYTNAATGTAAPSAGSTVPTAKFSYGWGGALLDLTKKLVGVSTMALTALPTSNEAIAYDTLTNRLKFYSQNKMKDYGNPSMYASLLGTPTEPLDALMASNVGIEAGLLPGLPNYQAGLKGKRGSQSAFGGVYGSAALASNLVPGIGIQGGMQIMGGINQAQNVNMLRMFGIDIRGGSGDRPADLASIIDQLYNILSKSGTVSPYNIAVSAMSGNALDSILTQYFGTDVNTRNAVIAGLIQRSRKGSLYKSGTKAELMLTGGLGTAATSLGTRTASEYGMIKGLNKGAIQGEVGANNALQGIYDYMGKESNNKAILNAQYAVGLMEGVLGARGGAGAAVFNTQDKAGALPLIMAGLMGTSKALSDKGWLHLGNAGLFGEKINSSVAKATSGGNTFSPATGPSFSGGLTINLQLPPGTDDPMLFGKAVAGALQPETYGKYYQ